MLFPVIYLPCTGLAIVLLVCERRLTGLLVQSFPLLLPIVLYIATTYTAGI